MKEAVNQSLEAVVLAARRRRHADRLDKMTTLDLAKPSAHHEWVVPQGSV